MARLSANGNRALDASGAVSARETGLVGLVSALNAATDLRSTLLATASGAALLSGAARAVLLLTDETSTRLVLGATCGGGKTATTGFCLPLTGPLAEYLANHDHPAVVRANDGVAQCLAPLLQLCCDPTYPVAVAPLRNGSALLGTLLLELPGSSPAQIDDACALAHFLEQGAIAISKASTVEALRLRVDDLSALITLDEALTDAVGFEEVLGEIIERVKKLVDVESGGLVLYNPDTDELVLQKPALGASEELIRRTRLPLKGGGIPVNVFRTGKPYLSNDVTSDPSIPQRFVQLYRVRNALTVPVSINNRRIGVFHVVNKRHGDFTENDLQLVSLLASHLAIHVQNARLLENERQTVAKLQELNQIIDRQREVLQRTLAMHDDLTQMVLNDDGLAAIIAALGRLLASPVAVEDRYGNLIGCYPPTECADLDGGSCRTIVGNATRQSVRDELVVRAMLARLDQDRRPVRFPPLPESGFEQPRVVAPVVVGREILGYVYVLERDRCLDELDFVAVERASTAIALEIMKEKAAAQAQYKVRGHLVAELLCGNYGSEELLLNRATYLGIDLRVPRAVLVVDVDDWSEFTSGGQPEGTIQTLKARVLDVVERACRRAAPAAVVAARSDGIVILATAAGTKEPDRRAELVKLGDDLRAEVRNWLPELSASVGIGGVCTTLAGYARSYEQARHALDAVKSSRQRDRTVSFDQLGLYGVLFAAQNRDNLIRLVDDALGGLMEYDRRRGAELVRTLDQFFLQNCHLELTAVALQVHLCTVRYRLRRIEEISGVDLRSVETRFNMQLALRVWRGLNPR